MLLDNERKDPFEVSWEVRDEHRRVLLELKDFQDGINSGFTQQDVKNGLAELVVLVQRRRPLKMAIRDIGKTKGKLLAKKLQEEVESAERRIQFA